MYRHSKSPVSLSILIELIITKHCCQINAHRVACKESNCLFKRIGAGIWCPINHSKPSPNIAKENGLFLSRSNSKTVISAMFIHEFYCRLMESSHLRCLDCANAKYLIHTLMPALSTISALFHRLINGHISTAQ